MLGIRWYIQVYIVLLHLQYIIALKADMKLSLSKNKQVEAGPGYHLVILIPPHPFFSGLLRALEHWQHSRGEFGTVLQN